MPRINEVSAAERLKRKQRKFRAAPSMVNGGWIYSTQQEERKPAKRKAKVDLMTQPKTDGYLAAKALLEARA